MVNVLHLLKSPGAAAVQLLPPLADAAIKGVVVFGVAAVAVALLRRRSAATRHAIWAGAVAAQLTLPGLSALLPAWRVPLVERLDRQLAMPAAISTLDLQPAPAPVKIAVAPVARGFGSGRGFGVARPGIVYAGPAKAPRARAIGAFVVGEGGEIVVRQKPAFSLIGTLRAVRNRTPMWWVRAAAVVW